PTYAAQQGMSALPPKADMCGARGDVCYGPKADIATGSRLLDHLIGRDNQARWHLEPERLRGLEVEHGFVLGRHLHRQVGRSRAAQYAVDVGGSVPEHVELVGPVGHEAASNDEHTKSVHRRQAVARRKCDDKIAMSERRGVRRQKQTAVRLAREGIEGTR